MRVALVAAMTALFSCVIALAEPPPFSLSDRPSQDGRCIGDKGVGDLDRSEQACLEQVGDLARRIGPGLQLKFRSGLTRVYVDEDVKCHSETAEGYIRFKLTGYFPKHDLMLIEVGYWEGASWLLVRTDTGAASEIVAPPHYSPDQRWLASVASGVGPSGPPDGMDLVPTLPIRLSRSGTTASRTMTNGSINSPAGTAIAASGYRRHYSGRPRGTCKPQSSAAEVPK